MHTRTRGLLLYTCILFIAGDCFSICNFSHYSHPSYYSAYLRVCRNACVSYYWKLHSWIDSIWMSFICSKFCMHSFIFGLTHLRNYDTDGKFPHSVGIFTLPITKNSIRQPTLEQNKPCPTGVHKHVNLNVYFYYYLRFWLILFNQFSHVVLFVVHWCSDFSFEQIFSCSSFSSSLRLLY